MKITLIVLVALSLLCFSQAVPLLDFLSGNPELSDLTALILNSTLPPLPGSGVTLFAPTNAAFRAARFGQWAADSETPLDEILLYHIFVGVDPVLATNLSDGLQFETTANVFVRINGSDVYFNGNAQFVSENLVDEGVVHIIDGVLEYPGTSDADEGAQRVFSDDILGEYGNLLTAVLASPEVSLPGPESTILAPVNAGLSRTPDASVLSTVLEFHFIPATLFSVDVLNLVGQTVGGMYTFTMTDEGIVINNQATVLTTDIFTGNASVIHTITQAGSGTLGYLIPSSFELPDTLLALGLGDLVNAAVTFEVPVEDVKTLFAPDMISEDAEVNFDFLAYHALDSVVLSSDLTFPSAPATIQGDRLFITQSEAGSIFFNGVQLSMSPNNIPYVDISTDRSNFVVHILEKELPFPNNTDIATGATGAGLSTLVSLIGAANITLPAEGTLTVFAPTNEAFTALEAAVPGVTDYLLANPDVLAEVLALHVLTEVYAAAHLMEAPITITTFGEDELLVNLTGGQINSQDVNVVVPDVFLTNGVVHVIDTVLVPAGFVLPEMTEDMTEDMTGDMTGDMTADDDDAMTEDDDDATDEESDMSTADGDDDDDDSISSLILLATPAILLVLLQ